MQRGLKTYDERMRERFTVSLVIGIIIIAIGGIVWGARLLIDMFQR